jgi:hypothetical protein
MTLAARSVGTAADSGLRVLVTGELPQSAEVLNLPPV